MRLTVPPELIEAARSGKEDGMERLLRTLWPHAYRIARSIIQNDVLAEDAAQEACALIYRELPRLRSTGAFRGWAYRIVAREAVRVAKRNAQAPREEHAACHADVDAKLDVLRALAKLPPALRAVVVLHYYADLSSSEIGGVLRIPSATVRFRLAIARKKLGTLLDSQERVYAVPEVCQ